MTFFSDFSCPQPWFSLQEAYHQAKKRQGSLWRERLILALGEDLGFKNSSHEAFAQNITLFHGASLLHDDVMDGGSLRGFSFPSQGESSVGSVYNGSLLRQGVLLGDYLLLQCLLSMKNLHPSLLEATLKTLETMIEGQWQEGSLGPQHDLGDYRTLAKKKTGKLFGLCAYGTFLLAFLNPSQSTSSLKFLRSLGPKIEDLFNKLGTLYQYKNDLQNYYHEEGRDEAQKLWTFPIFLGAQHNISPPWIEEKTWEKKWPFLLEKASKFLKDYFCAYDQDFLDLEKTFSCSFFKTRELWTAMLSLPSLHAPLSPNKNIDGGF